MPPRLAGLAPLRGGVRDGTSLQPLARAGGMPRQAMPASGSPHPAADPFPADSFTAELLALAPRLRAFLRRLSGADVDDLAQETWARAWRSRASFDRDCGDLAAWLMRIAFRTYLDHRSKRSPDALGDRDVAGGESAQALATWRDEVEVALACLTPIERDIVLRFHRDRFPVAEIAIALRMPEGTVKSHLHRARVKLAERGRVM